MWLLIQLSDDIKIHNILHVIVDINLFIQEPMKKKSMQVEVSNTHGNNFLKNNALATYVNMV